MFMLVPITLIVPHDWSVHNWVKLGPWTIPTCEALNGEMQGTHFKFCVNLIIVKLAAQIKTVKHLHYGKNKTDHYLAIKYNF